MENYRIKLKTTMTYQLLGVVALIPLAAYCLYFYFNTEPVVSGSSFLDFVGGFFNGVRGALVLGFILFLAIRFFKNRSAMKSEEKLRSMFNEEHDERNAAIDRAACKLTINLLLYLLLVACLIAGIFSTAVSLTLLAVWVVLAVTRIIACNVYQSKM